MFLGWHSVRQLCQKTGRLHLSPEWKAVVRWQNKWPIHVLRDAPEKTLARECRRQQTYLSQTRCPVTAVFCIIHPNRSCKAACSMSRLQTFRSVQGQYFRAGFAGRLQAIIPRRNLVHTRLELRSTLYKRPYIQEHPLSGEWLGPAPRKRMWCGGRGMGERSFPFPRREGAGG